MANFQLFYLKTTCKKTFAVICLFNFFERERERMGCERECKNFEICERECTNVLTRPSMFKCFMQAFFTTFASSASDKGVASHECSNWSLALGAYNFRAFAVMLSLWRYNMPACS
jgi:hypothetical protein